MVDLYLSLPAGRAGPTRAWERDAEEFESVMNLSEDVILYFVTQNPAIGGVELAGMVVRKLCHLQTEVPADLPGIFDRLVAEGRMREIEIAKPGAHRVTSLFLPAGTRIRVVGPEPQEACPACEDYPNN
jgi:hypothetical protein